MTVDFQHLDYIVQLRKAGLRPSIKLAQRIIALGEAAVEPLLDLALDSDLVNDESEASFAPIHALRLLGELHATRVIEPLLHSAPIDYGYSEQEGSAAEVWDSELPQILGSFGIAALEPLWAFVDDQSNAIDSRSAALTALAYATAVITPEERAVVIAGLKERLEAAEDPIFAAHVLMGLANIGVPDVYSLVMALYKAGKIDREVVPPGTARQLLLSPGTKRLACAKHPLWERYDQHGPFPRNQYAR